jgi:hypothetical protein
MLILLCWSPENRHKSIEVVSHLMKKSPQLRRRNSYSKIICFFTVILNSSCIINLRITHILIIYELQVVRSWPSSSSGWRLFMEKERRLFQILLFLLFFGFWSVFPDLCSICLKIIGNQGGCEDDRSRISSFMLLLICCCDILLTDWRFRDRRVSVD